MLSTVKVTIAAAVALGGVALSPVVASAMPMIDTTPAVIAHSDTPDVVQAYWHRGWHRGGWHLPWGWHRHWGWWRHW